jgi:hypothetical protein
MAVAPTFSFLPGSPSAVSILPSFTPSSKPEEIRRYAEAVRKLVDHPQPLDALSPRSLWLTSNGLDGYFVKQNLSAEEWSDLKKDEIKLIGEIITSLLARLDPSIDLKKDYSLPSTNKLSVKNPNETSQEYDARMAVNEKESAARKMELYRFENQLFIRQQMFLIAWRARDYLQLLAGETHQEREDLMQEGGYSPMVTKIMTEPEPKDLRDPL